MERLKYIVEDSTIAELLGVQNFTNKESAILELVKNAYDAQANNVSITFSDSSIVIIDDGIGMSKSTIYENWMHVGKSNKGYSLSNVEHNDGRVLAGSKGVGRFALARLGESVVVSILDELDGTTEIDSPDGEWQSMLKKLGDFSAEFYFSLKSATKQDVERFCYNYSALPDRYDAGVVLYRNAFSIDSFDGKKDWLGLNQRSRKSPAAATHPTGSWRVRANQLSGKVEIDKKENYQLRDLANRQGLEENEYFKLFVKIITIGIAAFERYRQSIIRSIDKKNAPKPSPTTPIIDQILKGRNQEIHLTSNDVQALAQELSAIKAESKSFQDEKESTEKKYRYDVRILNVLATTGLKASSIAHELKNDRNSISVNYQYIVDALKEYGFWEELFINPVAS